MSYVVLDTDVASRIIKGKLTGPLATKLTGLTWCVTFVTVGELWQWAEARSWGQDTRTLLDQWLARVVVIDSDDDVSRVWGQVAARARRRGRPRPANDSWIAACCLAHGLPLATSTSGLHRARPPRRTPPDHQLRRALRVGAGPLKCGAIGSPSTGAVVAPCDVRRATGTSRAHGGTAPAMRHARPSRPDRFVRRAATPSWSQEGFPAPTTALSCFMRRRAECPSRAEILHHGHATISCLLR